MGRNTPKRNRTRKVYRRKPTFTIKHQYGGSVCPPPACQFIHNCPNNPIQTGEVFCKKHLARGMKILDLKKHLSGNEPSYNPDSYNKDPAKRHSHNCYAYALQIETPEKIENCRLKENCSFDVPGEKQGHAQFSGKMGKTCSDILARTIAATNGYPTTFITRPRKGYRKIAIVVDEKRDFHYYLQHDSGWWSHKPGATEVTDKDAYGAKIFRPDLASRCYKKMKGDDELNYTNFCTYLCIPVK
jgi:hypothetical protein